MTYRNGIVLFCDLRPGPLGIPASTPLFITFRACKNKTSLFTVTCFVLHGSTLLHHYNKQHRWIYRCSVRSTPNKTINNSVVVIIVILEPSTGARPVAKTPVPRVFHTTPTITVKDPTGIQNWLGSLSSIRFPEFLDCSSCYEICPEIYGYHLPQPI